MELVVTPLRTSGGSYLLRYWLTLEGGGRGDGLSQYPTPPSFHSPRDDFMISFISGNDRTGFFPTEPNRTEFEKRFYLTEPNRISVTEPNRTMPNHSCLNISRKSHGEYRSRC
eukprot:sb/3476960/